MAEHDAWLPFYKTGFWQRQRRFQLRQEPLCAFCLKRGVVTVARVVDHVEPHKGDWNKFRLGKVQSLCDSCHNSSKRYVEVRGHNIEVGSDGWPLDPKHPANKQRG